VPRESVKDRRIGAISRSRREERREPGWDQEIVALARQQHGVVARRQLRGLGLGKDAIQHRLASGRLHPIHAGVYSVAPRPLISRQGQWVAAMLASGPDAVLSHQTAAALWGIRDYSRGAIHITVPHKSTPTKRIHRHFSIVPPDERAVEEEFPVSSVHRTIFDLAATEDLDAVISMIKEAEYLNRWDRLSLPDLLERYPGKRGSRKVRAALERLREEPPGRKRSKLEERFAPFLRHHRLPLPCFNDWILLGPKRYQVDCHWASTGRIVELDGWEGHHTRSAFRGDRERDRRLTAAGYTVTRLTWNQLDDEPEQIAADLRSLLASASRSLSL
jgi:very-short-patch-repair endonuclease